MGQVTDIKQVKADLVGRYAVQLSKVIDITEILVEHYHKTAITHGKMAGHTNHTGTFATCDNSTCISVRNLISDSRQLISQGV